MQLRLSAHPELHCSQGVRVHLAERDAALLAWLAIEGPTPRGRLAGLLWPERDEDTARNALRQRLFQLRRHTGAELVSGAHTLALASGVTHDLADSDAVLGDGRYDIGAEFDSWLEQQRGQRRSRVRMALIELCELAQSVTDWPGALAHAQELLAFEPLNEEAHRRVMRLHYLSGNPASALLAFDRCEQMLKNEVGTRPSAETLALLETIGAAQTQPAPTTTLAVPASVLLPPRMIGRDAELATLRQAWQAEQVVALIGEAGLGKTRLLQAFATGQTGVVYAAGRPGDAGVPFATLARLLRAVIARSAGVDGLDDQLPAHTRGEIARVLPEFDVPAPRHTGEGQRLVLQRAVRAMLATQADLAGLLVDDLHFADEASLDMLRSLIDEDSESGNAAARPLHWALAYRQAEAGSPVQALHDALVEQARLAPIALAPLGQDALAALVDSLALPGVDGKALAPGLLRRTGGNPLFVLETLKQAWVERTLSRLATDAALPRPLSVGRLIERRIAQLSPGAMALARVASIAGADFSIGMAEQVLQVSAMQFADALNELESAQVMRGDAFAHDLVFDAVRASVPATIAAHTHAQVAAHLEPRDGEPARIAQHWIDALAPRRALPWLAKAADKARHALRMKECIAFLERKSEIEEATGDQAAAFVSLLDAAEQFVNVDLDAAHSAAHCDRLDRLASSAEEHVEALLQRGHMHQQRGEYLAAERLARAALEAGANLGDERLAMRCHRALSAACVMGTRFAEGAKHLERCIAWFDENGNDAERSECHGDLSVMYDNLGRLDDALPHHKLAYELSCRSGNLSNASMACGNYACNRLDAGDLNEADRSLLQGLQLVGAYDEFGAHVGTLQVMRTLCLCHLGRYTEALDQAELSLVSMQRHQIGRLNDARLRLASCWWHLGQWSRVAQQLSSVVLDAQASPGNRIGHAQLRWHYARAMTAGTADTVAARILLETALAAFVDGERPDLRLPLLIELATDLEPAAALRQLDAAREEAALVGLAGAVWAPPGRSAGVAARFDPARARREALAALALARVRQTTALLPAELWLHCAQALEAAGDYAHAREVAAEGQHWVETTAALHVPEAFRDSFRHRNPVNREMLAIAARLQA